MNESDSLLNVKENLLKSFENLIQSSKQLLKLNFINHQIVRLYFLCQIILAKKSIEFNFCFVFRNLITM
jgi:hypothetical protein